jgi:hypothetical protein
VTNEELLSELRARLEHGEISLDQLLRSLPETAQITPAELPTTAPGAGIPSSGVTRLLYIVGAILIILGVLYLVSQLWDDLNSFNRIFITLGLGLAFAASGSYFMLNSPDRDIGSAFHTIGGFMVPGGALVTLKELGEYSGSSWPFTFTIGMVFLFYLLLLIYHRKQVLTFLVFANGTALAYLLLNSILPNARSELYTYLTMATGASYLLYAHALRDDWNDRLIPLLLFFGALGFYAAAFSRIFDNRLMEALFHFLAFGGLALAVQLLRSRIVLLLSTLAVISYFIYITAEYFADSIGWPVALILLGFVVIGLGFVSLRLNRKYLRS